MNVVVVTLHLRAVWCKSLKDKRAEVKKLVMGLRNNFNVSACESGTQDDRQAIEISACALAFDRAQGDSIAQSIEEFVSSRTDAILLATQTEYR